jgi:hypothetical protein
MLAWVVAFFACYRLNEVSLILVFPESDRRPSLLMVQEDMPLWDIAESPAHNNVDKVADNQLDTGNDDPIHAFGGWGE